MVSYCSEPGIQPLLPAKPMEATMWCILAHLSGPALTVAAVAAMGTWVRPIFRYPHMWRYLESRRETASAHPGTPLPCQPPALPADYETTDMARLRRETHARMLGNGLCGRPAELDCRMESACQTCAYFRTGPEFLPILTRQRDHARDHGQTDRAEHFTSIIHNVEQPLDNDHPADSVPLAQPG